MRKWIKRLVITLLILVLVLIIVVMCLVKEAFGPQERTVTIKNSNGSSLICKETYNADLTAVFYDVDFTLKRINGETIYLGSSTFNTDKWQKYVHYQDYGGWQLLYSNSKLSMIKPENSFRLDTLFSALELRYDSLWKLVHDDIPAWPYSGSAHIDTLVGQILKVSYGYRIGDYPPFKFYLQTIDYRLDTAAGQIKTWKVYTRLETKNGS